MTIREAIERGDLRAVKRILAADPSLVHARSSSSDTPLHYAVWHDNEAIARRLLAGDAGR